VVILYIYSCFPGESDMIVIDRFEGDTAVCESRCGQVLIPRASLPPCAAEGDVVAPRGDGSYAVDHAATRRRQISITSRFAKLTSERREK